MRSCLYCVVPVTAVQRTSIPNLLDNNDQLKCYVMTVYVLVCVCQSFAALFLLCVKGMYVFRLNCGSSDSSRHDVIDCTYCPEIITSLADACAAALSSVFVRMRRRTFLPLRKN